MPAAEKQRAQRSAGYVYLVGTPLARIPRLHHPAAPHRVQVLLLRLLERLFYDGSDVVESRQ